MINRFSTAMTATCLASIAALALFAMPAGAATSSATQRARTFNLAGQIAVTGRIIGASGHAAAGAQIFLYAWPASWPGKGTPHQGERVPLHLVGTARSTRSGRYTVRISHPAALSSAAAADGIVNLEAFAAASGGSGSYSFPRRIVTSSSRTAIVGPDVRSTAHATPETADIHLLNTTSAGARNLPASGMVPDDNICFPLGAVLKNTYALAWTKVGAAFARYAGVNMSFTYAQGQDTTIGIGTSATGAKGSFTGGGTAETSLTTTQNFGTQDGPFGVEYETEFEPGLYEISFYHNCSSPVWQTQPVEWAGGSRRVDEATPDATYCVHYESPTTFTVDTTQAYTFSAGLTVPALAFTASAETGYDTDASIEVDVTSSQYVCGTFGYPASDPVRLVGGRPSS